MSVSIILHAENEPQVKARSEHGDVLNVEIERQTQVFVDTLRAALDERLGPLLPQLERLLEQQGRTLESGLGPMPALMGVVNAA